MSLKGDVKFQKALALAASASNSFEADAAERAARRLMEIHNIDPIELPNVSLYNRMNFANNALLKKLRDEWRAAHPHRVYRADRSGHMRWANRPKAAKPAPVYTSKHKAASAKPTKPQPASVNTSAPEAVSPIPFDIDGFRKHAQAKPVNTRSDRNRDRHSLGYMREYMRRRRAHDREA